MSDKKFKVGDKVDHYGHIGVITATSVSNKDDGGKLGAMVEWDDKNLVPPEMRIPYKDLLFVGEKNTSLPAGCGFGLSPVSTNAVPDTPNCELVCPVCRNEWQETIIMKNKYYDCLTCNSKKEDIMKKYILTISKPDMVSGDRR